MFIESIQQVANAAAASEGSTKKLGKLLLVISGICIKRTLNKVDHFHKAISKADSIFHAQIIVPFLQSFIFNKYITLDLSIPCRFFGLKPWNKVPVQRHICV